MKTQQTPRNRLRTVSKDGRIQVSVYAVQRCYGGPEEGGWYYDTNEFMGVSERVPPDQVEQARKRLEELFADEQPLYPIGSVLSNGPEYHIVTETHAGDSEMLATPSDAES